ncbi:MAG: uroporphyrinogen decarboxylase [Alphaproteobacteria bacterium]
MSGGITKLLQGQKQPSPPIWLMRQAGRYLPEYRSLRQRAKSFLHLCLTPEWATEVTLQPIRRFDLSAAIIFSDILVVPWALGMGLDFQTGEGPKLEKEKLANIIQNDFTESSKEDFLKKLSPILLAINQTRKQLARDKDLIGFAGAPWTLFCYMVEGESSPNFADAINFAKTHPIDFEKIISILTEAVVVFLTAQKYAGADIIKIFDSWAGLIPHDMKDIALYQPHKKIISAMRAINSHIICFPKGDRHLPDYQKKTTANIIAIDHHTPMADIAISLPQNIILQGNLAPELLKNGGAKMIESTSQQLTAMQNKSYIFNLGHGIDKDTPIKNVTALVNFIRKFG